MKISKRLVSHCRFPQESSRGKRALPLLLLAVVLLLSACGKADREDKITELPPEPEEDVLVYAALNPVTSELRSSVENFNSTHADAQIEIQDYSDEGGAQRLLLELVAGRIPDIMELQRAGRVSVGADPAAEALWFSDASDPMGLNLAGSYWLPYRQLAQKGYLEDLWPYIENDPELGRESVLEAPLKAAEVNGGLYILFGQVSINTMMGPKAIIGDQCGWTLEDLMEAFSAMPAGSTILRYNATKSDVFFKLIGPALDQYVDWETGQCSFDNADFRSMLAFLNSFPSEFETSLSASQIRESLEWKLIDGLQLLESIKIGLLRDLPFFETYYPSGASYVGYPTADGSFGGSFIIHGDKLAMSSRCGNKDAAWDFMRELILQRYDENSIAEAHSMQQVRLSINRADYDLGNQYDIKNKSVAPRITSAGPTFDVTNATEDDIQRLDTLINSTTQIYWPDSELSDIVWEAIGPYLAGDRSLDDTVALVQNRVSLYVNEQR